MAAAEAAAVIALLLVLSTSLPLSLDGAAAAGQRPRPAAANATAGAAPNANANAAATATANADASASPADAAAAARLAEVRAQFAARPKAASMAALSRLGNEAPDTPAGARALDWLADLLRGDGDVAGARDAYARAYRSRDPEAHRLAARGLGDLDVEAGAFVRGAALFREARAGATGVLALELDQKIANARKLHRRALGEWAAWGFVGALLAFLLARARPWRRPWPGLPTEALYVVPVYALLVAGCLGRDAAVLHALWMCALWSTALILAAGLAARRSPPSPAGRWALAAAVAVANVALFFAVCNRAGILDSLFFTVAP